MSHKSPEKYPKFPYKYVVALIYSSAVNPIDVFDEFFESQRWDIFFLWASSWWVVNEAGRPSARALYRVLAPSARVTWQGVGLLKGDPRRGTTTQPRLLNGDSSHKALPRHQPHLALSCKRVFAGLSPLFGRKLGLWRSSSACHACHLCPFGCLRYAFLGCMYSVKPVNDVDLHADLSCPRSIMTAEETSNIFA